MDMVAAGRGFTLLEVLIALIIFAISFGAIANIFQTALRQSTTAALLLDAKALAEQQMARIGADLPLEPGEHTGTVAAASRSALTWQSRVALAEPPGDDASLVLYQVTVDIGEEASDRSLLTLQTLRIGTTP